jgi:hypothetical protein
VYVVSRTVTFEKCQNDANASLDECRRGCRTDYNIAMGHEDSDDSPPAEHVNDFSANDFRSMSGGGGRPLSSHAKIEPDGVAFVTKDGVRLSCTVERTVYGLTPGSTVPVRLDPSALFTGFTRVMPGKALISFRPDIDLFSGNVQQFMFVHECGHVNSGDAGMTKEISANCWAAGHTTLDPNGWNEVHQMLVQYYPLPRPPYPDGQTQWNLMQQSGCFAQR